MQIIITNPIWLLIPILAAALFLALLVMLAKPVMRFVTAKISNDIMSKILSDKYTQNIAEFLPSLKRVSLLNAIELNLRAESGKVIARPLGSPKHYLSFENLMFAPRQMARLSLSDSTQVDMQVAIGLSAERPLFIDIPLMISGMAYGLALSERAKVALAIAANSMNTAIGSGEGPILPEEQEKAKKWILQISRWSWGGRTAEQIRCASMLEVQVGQGADVGAASVEAAELTGRARVLGGLEVGENAIALPAPPGIAKKEDWPAFMANLRRRANGIPIALKFMATGNLEEDLAAAVELGFDAVVIDSAQGGSHATPPIKQDDFGIPTLEALVRAKRFLGERPISLIISGGFFTPGQCLKALALGVDAINLGTVPLFALTHNQAEKVTPWEPLTTLVYYDSPDKTKLDVRLAATSVTNTLTSMVLEMEEAMRALGKASLRELSPDDLVAIDAVTAEMTGVRRGPAG